MLFRSKIVTPHLVIAPRFAWDESGRWAVSHSPYIVPKSPASPDEYLFLLAVLNSTPCFWIISENAHNYSRGYSRLEVATLKNTPIPDSALMDPLLLREIIRLSTLRMSAMGNDAVEMNDLISERVAEAYNLSMKERKIIGMVTI